MVYLASQNLGYKPYFLRWLNVRNNKTESKMLKPLFDKYIPPALEYLYVFHLRLLFDDAQDMSLKEHTRPQIQSESD